MSGQLRVLSGILIIVTLGLSGILPSTAGASVCLNETFRSGASAELPDCRAYELVTPTDTNGRLLETISYFTLGRAFDLFPTELASPVRDSFVYETFAGALSAPAGGSGIFDMYEAERSGEGWQTTKHLSRSSTSRIWPLPGGISADHSYSFQDEGNTSIFAETYLRSPDGSEELIGIGSLGTEPRAQGRYISVGGEHVIFSTGNLESQSPWCNGCPVNRLEPDAAPTGTGAIYDRSPDGPTHVVSLLPGNEPAAAGEQAFFKGVSKDASAVAFTINGVLYVRLNNAETLEVASGSPAFGGLSDDGRYLFYLVGGTIHRFETTTKGDVEVNPVGEGELTNVSADGSHVYFISEQQLDGSKGTAGQPNMYVWSGGAPEYVATVAPSDLMQTSGHLTGLPALTNWTVGVLQPFEGAEAGPGADSSRTTPDGSVIVFESKAQLTTFDNDGHTEIYRYDDKGKSLQCISCNPGAAVPVGDARLQEVDAVAPPIIVHNVSDDGQRVFFETPEALAEQDTNGVNDIYEWEQAEETPSVHLISTGHSPEYPLPEGWVSNYFPIPNLLLAITPSGNDVFFAAKEALVPGAGEGGTQAIYDARVNGGFPVPLTPEECAEEACRPAGSGSSSIFQAPQSETKTGSGNVKAKKKRHCHRARGRGSKKHQGCVHHGKRKARSSTVVASAPTLPGGGAGQSTSLANPLAADQQLSPNAPKTPAAAVTTSAAENEEFAIKRFEGKLSTPDAAMHPDFTTTLEFTHFFEEGSPNKDTASASAETISIKVPPGLIGNPGAFPTCDTGAFVSLGNCPTDSQIGITNVKVGRPNYTTVLEPIYNLVPPHPDQEVARLGFFAYSFPIFIDIRVRTASDYGVTAIVHDAPGLGAVVRATTTLWANPASSSHDDVRLTPIEAAQCESPATCKVPGGRPSTIPAADRKAFMTNPSACQEGSIGAEVTAYQLPGQVLTASAPLPSITNCTGLPFAPSFEAEPTSHVAGAPTGLKTTLKVPQHLGEEERSTATMREARVTLPEGMQVAAGAANWIGTCSEEQVGFHEEVDAACPDSSKLGTATFISPAISMPIEGTIYQRTPRPGHQLGLWLVSDDLGLHIKLPGELEPDPSTGRLTAVFRDLPQVPVEEIDLDVWGGPRAPLQNPDHCGTFATDYTFAPHSEDPALSAQSQMQITEGCDQGFSPTLHAGVEDPTAGAYSPFVFDLNREDGQQALRGLELHLPEGEIAKPKGVPLCPDTAATAGTCPAASRIGTVQATTGPGPEPLQVPQPGKAQPAVYFAGPYQGAPYSIVTEVPAQAGPFDLGVLAVRSALEVDPETTQVTVKADPLPQFFEGVGIAYRHIHVVVDRPEFDLNPTDCREMEVTSDVTSTLGTVAHPKARFQVDGCKALKYTPKLKLSFRGQPQRTGNPAVKAVLTQKPHQANTSSATVLLPQGEFIDNAHIGNPCTMPQFQAEKCPKKSILGTVKATTPLLAEPLKGKIYFRSNGGARELPDIVADLRGPIHVVLVGYIDAVKTGPESSRVRTRFLHVPDAPVAKATFSFFGGKRGLIENSTDLCHGTHRAKLDLIAQNGRAVHVRPRLETSCPKKKLGKHHKKHR
jgi:hypothetical protein